jgi:hypothetical protein
MWLTSRKSEGIHLVDSGIIDSLWEVELVGFARKRGLDGRTGWMDLYRLAGNVLTSLMPHLTFIDVP